MAGGIEIPFEDDSSQALFTDGAGWSDEGTSIVLDPMSIQTYSALKLAVTNWMARPELNTQVNDFVAIAESRANRKLRIMLMEAVATVNIAAQQVPLPLLFRGTRTMQLTSPKRHLKYVTPEQYYDRWGNSSSGCPETFTILNKRLYFGPPPDGAYVATLIYWKGFQPLSDDAPTNDLLTYHPDLYLYGSLVAGEQYLHNDPRFMMWRQEYDRIIEEIKDEDRHDRIGGSALRPLRKVRERR